MEKHLDSMVMVARGASRNVRIVRMYPLTVLFTFTMVIIINSILGLRWRPMRVKKAGHFLHVQNHDLLKFIIRQWYTFNKNFEYQNEERYLNYSLS